MSNNDDNTVIATTPVAKVHEEEKITSKRKK